MLYDKIRAHIYILAAILDVVMQMRNKAVSACFLIMEDGEKLNKLYAKGNMCTK